MVCTLTLLLALNGCKKYMEEKSDKKLVVLETPDQAQSLLDNFSTINTNYCSAGEVSSDNYYLTNEDYDGLEYDTDRRLYTWQSDDLFEPGTNGNDWDNTYKAIYSANTILEFLEKHPRNIVNGQSWDNLMGQALFIRGTRLADAAYIWCKAYDAGSAGNDPGLPLRAGTDFNVPSVRSSLSDTYAQAVSDLKTSAALLPVSVAAGTRSSKPAALGMLARLYLNMRDYGSAGRYADSCLKYRSALIDFNTLDPTASYPVGLNNNEAIFYATLSVAYPLLFATPKIDSTLYQRYQPADLRKAIFFQDNGDGTFSFKGNYTGDFSQYSGPAVDEMYLIRAECLIRTGDVKGGLDELNILLKNRFRSGTFTPYIGLSATNALDLVLTERRKELLMRGLRWMDIKRLNVDGAKITLRRNINGQAYLLPPNDLRYALPIPEDVIAASGLPQNPR
jgi:hypothetical protein